MNNKRVSLPSITFSFIFPLFILYDVASAAVEIYDSVTAVNRAVKLTAFTKGRFFSEGGRLVDFYIDGRHIGRTLSGGDGYAYLHYTPRQGGVKKLEVRSGDDSATAVVLVMEGNERAVLVEVEAGLRRSVFQDEPRPGSLEAVRGFSDKYSDTLPPCLC